MLLKRTVSLILIFLMLFLLRTYFAFTTNLDRYRHNTQFQSVLADARWSLETTKVMLEEFLINPNTRSFRQLSAKYESFKEDRAFLSLREWERKFPTIVPVLSKREDFIYTVGLLIEQYRLGKKNERLYVETASQAFLISHEVTTLMIDLSVASTKRIAGDTWFFIAALGFSLVILVPFILFVVLWIRRRVVSRIFALERATCRIAEGDYGIEIDHSGSDEIASLARSFSRMQASIRETIKALDGEKEKFATILHSIGDAVIAVDRSGYVMMMNPIAEELTGWTSEDARDRPASEVFNIVKESTREAQDSPIDQVLETGKAVTLANHTVLLSRTGQEFHVADSASPIRVGSGPLEGVVLVFRDVTENNRMQALMIQSEKMLSVGGLAAGMAHEINNPLSGMLQTASVIESRLLEDLPANRDACDSSGITLDSLRAYMEARGIVRMLELMRESGARIGKIVNNMLSFARKSSSQVSTHDIAQLIDSAIELAATDYDMKKDYDFRKVTIKRSYSKGLPMVPCDSGQIQQVIMNILRNGSQAMQEAKTPSPRFDIRVYLERERPMVCLEISDNGPGMDESVKRRVFEPFFTTKPIGVGTGLGLSVSYFIVTENHRGEMEVQSEPGEGATFIIRLPYKNA